MSWRPALRWLFERAGIDGFDPRLGFLHDSACMTLEIPGRAESGFEVFFRDNPFQNRADDPVVRPLSRLHARSARPALRHVRRGAGGASAKQPAGPFAGRISEPVPLCDSQGFYLSSGFKARWYRLVPKIVQVGKLFFDDRETRERYAYYLIVNQIFSVIARAGHDGLASEAELLGILRGRLKTLAGELAGAVSTASGS
jgi:siderophore synthetase component